MKSSSSRLSTGPLAPTAASAASPMYWPTMTASTVLYSCWARLPISSGAEKSAMFFRGLPWVMSCAPKRALSLPAMLITPYQSNKPHMKPL